MQEAYPFTVKSKGKARDQWDLLELGAAVPGPNESLDSLELTKVQNPCAL
jgi:branched-chain amino acid transport system substrate-binding protein